MITYRKATADDIRPALNLAMKVFIEFNAPRYEQIAAVNFEKDCINNSSYINSLISGKNAMFVALFEDKIIGMVAERKGHIWLLFVDGAFHRQGIATTLMNNMVCALKLKGYNKILLDSSPYALPFYLNYGFHKLSGTKNEYGCIVIPIAYEPKEIWDVLDENGNKTGRYTERGRKMVSGDYHLVVHVWKHNKKGEWLINRRALTIGTSLDGKWETTGGAAIAGDDSLTAALRETKEELGIDLDPRKGSFISRQRNDLHSWFQDAWVFEWEGAIEDVRLQEGETCDVMWATADKIREMMASGEFLGKSCYPYFDEMVEKWGTTN